MSWIIFTSRTLQQLGSVFTIVMANLEQLPEPQRRHASRLSRVSYRWLRQKGPLAADLEECVQARKVIAEASLEASADELISTRDQQDPERYQMDRRYLKRLSKSWEELLKKTHRNCAESVVKELGPVHLEPLYPDLKVQEAFLQARKAHESVTTYTYHGTKKENIESISQIGFLMPGQGGQGQVCFWPIMFRLHRPAQIIR